MPKIILDIKLYTMEETAQLLGITKGTLTNYIKQKKISPRKIGGKKYFSEDCIKNFIQTSD